VKESAAVLFGGNLGDRLATLRTAAGALREVASVRATSHVYATAAVGPPQPDYLNAVALVDFDGSAEELLDALLAIEQRLGRVRDVKWGPRTIDLDILWIEGTVVDTPRLTVPHPRLHERAFALLPFLELVPDARDPRTGEPYVVPPGVAEKLGLRL
jgi:2-amino-4-hydroxy-6-hydroxymethyldihydropteridine diphosphokinase